MDNQTPVFDGSRQIDLMLLPGNRFVTVKQMTDEQLSRRQKSRKVIIRDLGRGASETTVENDEKVDSKILAEIRVAGEEEIDSAEASEALDRLSTVEILGAEHEGVAYRIPLAVLGHLDSTDEKGEESSRAVLCKVTHLLKTPTQRQLIDYRRSTTRIISHPFNRRELRMNYEAGATLYDALKLETENYAPKSPVPISHKSTVVSAIAALVDREMAGEAIDPANF